MDILNLIKGHEVFILTVTFLTAMTLYGHYRGLVRMLLSAASIVITLFISNMILPHTRAFLMEQDIFSSITNALGESLESAFSLGGESAADTGIIYELIDADRIVEDAAASVGGIALNIICFILIFIIIRLLLKLLLKVFDLITSIPVVSGLNQIGGALVGFAEALIYVWIVMAIAALTPSFGTSAAILSQTAGSDLLSFLYHNNIIVQLLLSIFGA